MKEREGGMGGGMEVCIDWVRDGVREGRKEIEEWIRGGMYMVGGVRKEEE